MARLVFLFKDANATCSPNINGTPSDLSAQVSEFLPTEEKSWELHGRCFRAPAESGLPKRRRALTFLGTRLLVREYYSLYNYSFVSAG